MRFEFGSSGSIFGSCSKYIKRICKFCLRIGELEVLESIGLSNSEN